VVDEGVLKDRATDARSGDRFLLVPFADSGSRGASSW